MKKKLKGCVLPVSNGDVIYFQCKTASFYLSVRLVIERAQKITDFVVFVNVSTCFELVKRKKGARTRKFVSHLGANEILARLGQHGRRMSE